MLARVQVDTLSHTTTVDHGNRTLIAAVRSKCIVNYATWTPHTIHCAVYIDIFEKQTAQRAQVFEVLIRRHGHFGYNYKYQCMLH